MNIVRSGNAKMFSHACYYRSLWLTVAARRMSTRALLAGCRKFCRRDCPAQEKRRRARCPAASWPSCESRSRRGGKTGSVVYGPPQTTVSKDSARTSAYLGHRGAGRRDRALQGDCASAFALPSRKGCGQGTVIVQRGTDLKNRLLNEIARDCQDLPPLLAGARRLRASAEAIIREA